MCGLLVLGCVTFGLGSVFFMFGLYFIGWVIFPVPVVLSPSWFFGGATFIFFSSSLYLFLFVFYVYLRAKHGVSSEATETRPTANGHGNALCRLEDGPGL